MALNFPTDTSQPYFDSASGLKYIFNTSIGAWETAIQPPAVISSIPPNIQIPGFLWWDEVEGRLYVWYESNGQGAWVVATPIPDPPAVIISPTSPPDPVQGDLWWNNINGRLYVYYTDSDSSQWVEASPEVPDFSSDPFISQGSVPPQDPGISDLWFDSVSGNLFIYYEDVDSSQWVICQNIDGTSGTTSLASIVATGAITIGGTPTDPIVSIATASTNTVGAVKLATDTEATAGTSVDTALSPGVLSTTISNYLPVASETAVGSVELATLAETIAGTDTTKVVTPKNLKDSLPSLSAVTNPIGTVITFATQTPPSGYIKCDGSVVSRTTYSNLFAAIGTTYGIGDSSTTFNLPTLEHVNLNLIYCIKF